MLCGRPVIDQYLFENFLIFLNPWTDIPRSEFLAVVNILTSLIMLNLVLLTQVFISGVGFLRFGFTNPSSWGTLILRRLLHLSCMWQLSSIYLIQPEVRVHKKTKLETTRSLQVILNLGSLEGQQEMVTSSTQDSMVE